MQTIPQSTISRYLEDRHRPACAYIYDLVALAKHVKHLTSLLPSQCQLTYAVKANSDPYVLQTLSTLVEGFDVASLGEIEKVRAISSQAKLALGGPAKTAEEFEAAIAQGTALYHIESLQQLRCLNEVAEAKDTQVDVLLRVNPDIATPAATLQMGGAATQFGIDQAFIHQAIQLCQSLPAIRLRGFHFHAISNNLDAEKHLSLIAEYIRLVCAWKNTHGLQLDYVNVGGGIGVNYQSLSQQFDWPFFCLGLEEMMASSDLGQETKIIFECGRFLTAFCGYYLTEVVDIKNNRGCHFALLRGGSHHFRLPVSWQHNHPFQIIPGQKWRHSYPPTTICDTDITLCGELCTPKDVLARKVPVNSLTQGDAILFLMAGAYGWHISHHDFLSHRHPDFLYVEGAEDAVEQLA